MTNYLNLEDFMGPVETPQGLNLCVAFATSPHILALSDKAEDLMSTHISLHVMGQGKSRAHDEVIKALEENQAQIQAGLRALWC